MPAALKTQGELSGDTIPSFIICARRCQPGVSLSLLAAAGNLCYKVDVILA
jgi:hypothetical protein